MKKKRIQMSSTHCNWPIMLVLAVALLLAAGLALPAKVFNNAFGVLAVNTTQAAYAPGEMAEIHAGLVDQKGRTICNARVSVQVRRKVPLPAFVFSRRGLADWLVALRERVSEKTLSLKTVSSGTCREADPMEPDYRALLPVSIPGIYVYEVTARSSGGVFFVRDQFSVEERPVMGITRRADTRIYPDGFQDVAIDLTARVAFRGIVTERVPDAFEVHPPVKGARFAGFIRDRKRGEKRIFWKLALKAGERVRLGYRYDVTAVSPRNYEIGPLVLSDRPSGRFQRESRAWQVASDVASGVIVAWPSTNASIPAGWNRVTALDTYYLQGTTSNPSAVAGGNATHTHTSPTHQHTLGGHTHNGTTGADGGTPTATGTGAMAAAFGHTHTITTDGNTDNNVAQSANLGTASNDPPYRNVIWIKADGTIDIPNGAWAFFNSDSLPTNWTRQSGNRFLKGAAAGGDGTGTGGSSDSHTHTDSGHTHTENSHTHTGTTSSVAATVGETRGGTADQAITHTHTISGGGVTATEVSGTATLANGDGQPPFTKLNIIQNGTGGNSLPTNIIAMWDGTVASIPPNWKLCDGSTAPSCPNMNTRFLKGANADTETGTTGGAATHTHGATGTAHSHTINAHQHTFTVSAPSASTRQKNAGSSASTAAHTHTLTTTSSGGTTGTAQISADANSDNRPPYKEIVYIQYTPTVATRWFVISMAEGIGRWGGHIGRGVIASIALARIAIHQHSWLLVMVLIFSAFWLSRQTVRSRVLGRP